MAARSHLIQAVPTGRRQVIDALVERKDEGREDLKAAFADFVARSGRLRER